MGFGSLVVKMDLSVIICWASLDLKVLIYVIIW